MSAEDLAPWLAAEPDLPRILTRRDALALGLTQRMVEHRVAGGTWRRILPSVYHTVDTLTWPDRQRAALAFGGPGALLSGAAALADLGLRGVQRPDQMLVLVPATCRRESSGFVRLRSTRRMPERALLPGPRRAAVARAVADLAEELAAGPRRGSADLRDAIADVDAGAWSAPEGRAAALLRRAGVPPFEQNAVVELPGGRRYVADFLWRRLRAIPEIDSDEHHGLGPDADATHQRHIELETLGYSVTHRRPGLVLRRPAQFTAEVSAWLAARARALGL